MDHNKKKCPYCGEEIMSTAKKCRHCGEWLENTEINKSVETKLSNKKVWILASVISVVVIGIIVFLIMAKTDKTSYEGQAEKQESTLSEDYSIDQVCFDLKSLVALNLMNKDEAQKLLHSSGWENVYEIGMGDKEDPYSGYIKFADVYLKNHSEDKQIVEHKENALVNGVGFIEFETSSKPIYKSMEKSIADMGYRISVDPSTSNPDDYRWNKEDTIHSPIYGLVIKVNYQDEAVSFPLDTIYTWYVKKLPELDSNRK